MKVVIDIPEDVYRRLKAGDTNAGNTFHNTALESIGNGVVLPKGHGRLYDEKVLHDYWGEKYDLPLIPCVIEADKENENDRN